MSSQPFGFTWQAIFVVNMPIGVAALIGSLLFLSDSPAPDAEKLDIAAVVLLSLTLGLGLGAPLAELSLFRDGRFVAGILMALLFYMLSSFYLRFSVCLQGDLHLTAAFGTAGVQVPAQPCATLTGQIRARSSPRCALRTMGKGLG